MFTFQSDMVLWVGLEVSLEDSADPGAFWFLLALGELPMANEGEDRV